MNHYKLEYLDKSIYLKIINHKETGCSLIFVGMIALFMFLNPILVILFLVKEITFGTILILALAWFISFYFVKLYLWNKYGEEVFVIKENSLETYNNYRFFKDNCKTRQFTKINIFFLFEEEAIYTDHFEKYKSININQLSPILFKLDDEMIKSHKEIPISEIIDIAKANYKYFK